MTSSQVQNTPLSSRAALLAWPFSGMFKAPVRCFAAVFLFTGLLTSLAAWGFGGTIDLLCSLISAGICGLCGAAALFVERGLQGPAQTPVKLLIGFLLRTGLPLTSVVVVDLRASWLINAGFAFYILGYYFLSLALGTGLSLHAARPRD